MIYKDSQKLEKTRKYLKSMPVNQGVLGSSPRRGAKGNLLKFSKLPFLFKAEHFLFTPSPCAGRREAGLVHSNSLYTAGVLGFVVVAIVYGKVSVRDTHKADIVRLSGLSGGAVFSSIWAK